MSVRTVLQVVRNEPTASSEAPGRHGQQALTMTWTPVSLLPLAQSSRHLHLGDFPAQAGGQGEQGHHCARADEDPAQTQLDQRAGDGV